MENVQGTADFIKIIVKFWNIVNVHGPYDDLRFRDPLRAAIRSTDSINLAELVKVADMAKAMCCSGRRVKCLTKDTSQGLSHTCRALADITHFLLLEKQMAYIMLGMFTSDPIEKEFGKLRQGSGGTYFITVQQIFEKVGIARAKLLLRLGDVILDGAESSHSCEKCGILLSDDMCDVLDNLPELEKSLTVDTIMTLVYIAGYIVRNDDDQLERSYFYYEQYGNFLKDLNRGGLCIPYDAVCQWVIYSYAMFKVLAEVCCRTSLCNFLMLISEMYELNMDRRHGMILSNILFKNYVVMYSPRSVQEPKQKILKLSV